MLKRLQQAVIENVNVFEVLMDRCVRALGEIIDALFEVGGAVPARDARTPDDFFKQTHISFI